MLQDAPSCPEVEYILTRTEDLAPAPFEPSMPIEKVLSGIATDLIIDGRTVVPAFRIIDITLLFYWDIISRISSDRWYSDNVWACDLGLSLSNFALIRLQSAVCRCFIGLWPCSRCLRTSRLTLDMAVAPKSGGVRPALELAQWSVPLQFSRVHPPSHPQSTYATVRPFDHP